MADKKAPKDSVNASTEEVEAFIFGKVAMAADISQRCNVEERRERMERAVTLFTEQLGLSDVHEAQRELQRRSLKWSPIERRMLLVDLWRFNRSARSTSRCPMTISAPPCKPSPPASTLVGRSQTSTVARGNCATAAG